MLYKETISRTALGLLNRLMQDSEINDFVLVGGTALALQIGHRISIDFDLFTDKAFDEQVLADYLRKSYQFEMDFISANTLKGEIEGIQIDCIAHQYPWIEKTATNENIRLASLYDIAAMKLNAIAGSRTRLKDFIDIAFLSGEMTFNKMLDGYERKYNSNQVIPVKALTYFDDINFNEPVKMMGKTTFEWKMIESRLKEMTKFPNKIFCQFLAER